MAVRPPGMPAQGWKPVRDLELVVSACLREKVFQGELREHRDPNVTMIEKHEPKSDRPGKFTRFRL